MNSVRPLSSLVSHAHRLARALADLERAGSPTHWLVGRADEIECFLDDLAADIARRRLGAPGAAHALGAYLDDVHRGAAAHLPPCPLPCCGETTTIPSAGHR